jgi:hypothetical protein
MYKNAINTYVPPRLVKDSGRKDSTIPNRSLHCCNSNFCSSLSITYETNKVY